MQRVPPDAIAAYRRAFATLTSPTELRGLEARQWRGFLDGYLGNVPTDVFEFLPVLDQLYKHGYEFGAKARPAPAAA